MNLKKSILSSVSVVCIILMMLTLLPFGVMAANTAANGYDIVVIVDDSGSMRQTDPQRLTQTAISKFAEKFGSLNNVNVGVATYNTGIVEKETLGDKLDLVKDFAREDKNFKWSGDTDAAVGMKWAVEQLESNGASSHSKAIIIIGDGQNDPSVSEEDSNKMLDEALKIAKDKDYNVYSLAINPKTDEFKEYFSNIASATGGTSHQPTTVGEVDDVMDKVYTAITGKKIDNMIIDLPAKQKVVQELDVPGGVFQMDLQCDYTKPISINFHAPDGTKFNEKSNGVSFNKEKTYCYYRISEPKEGKWKIEYYSDVAQKITAKFIMHQNLKVSLNKNQQDVMQEVPVEYSAVVSSQDGDVTDETVLKGFNAELVVSKLDDKGKVVDTYTEKMDVKNGELILEHKLSDVAKYEVYAKIHGDKNDINSNVITIDVVKNPDILPLWIKLLIGLGILILIILIIVIYTIMTTGAGTGLVRGNVSIKIVGRQQNDETMIFQQDIFDCLQVFGKKNTLSDLITAYVRRYRLNNSSELAELSLTQFINSTLYEVTDKISICGNKKKQTIITFPAGYETEVDGIVLSKDKTMKFSSMEKVIELRFNNRGCYYTINLIFTRM